MGDVGVTLEQVLESLKQKERLAQLFRAPGGKDFTLEKWLRDAISLCQSTTPQKKEIRNKQFEPTFVYSPKEEEHLQAVNDELVEKEVKLNTSSIFEKKQ